MSNLVKKIIILILFFAFAISLPYTISTKTNAESFSSACSEIVIERDSGRILYQNNIDERKYMASTTKILTALCVIENCNLSDEVTVTEESVGIEGSSIYLEKGEQLSVKDLLYGLMLRSGNDCAETLALYCSGSKEKFAILMNNTALKIGAKNSNFVTPHGLHDDNHYTTAKDLALISAYAMKNSSFREIVATKSVKIPFTTKNTYRYLKNKNKLLFNLDGTTGIKTGYTKKAGRCLVSSCERNGMELICVVLNCPPMFERSTTLFENCFSNYKLRKIAESDYILDFIKTTNNTECPVGVKNDVILPLTDKEYENLNIVYDLPKVIMSPLKKDSEIGSIKIYSENNLIFEEKIFTIIDI